MLTKRSAEPLLLSVEELDRAAREGSLDGSEAHPVLAVIARPQLRMVLERAVGREVARYQLWASPDLGVLAARHDDTTMALETHDPLLLPFAVARLVDFGRRPAASPALEPGEVAACVLADLRNSLGGLAPEQVLERTEQVQEALMDGGLHESFAAWFARVLGVEFAAWRMASCWADERDVLHDGMLTVLDGGEGGYVMTTRRTGPPATVELVPATTSQVWRAIVGLFPFEPDARQ